MGQGGGQERPAGALLLRLDEINAMHCARRAQPMPGQLASMSPWHQRVLRPEFGPASCAPGGRGGLGARLDYVPGPWLGRLRRLSIDARGRAGPSHTALTKRPLASHAATASTWRLEARHWRAACPRGGARVRKPRKHQSTSNVAGPTSDVAGPMCTRSRRGGAPGLTGKSPTEHPAPYGYGVQAGLTLLLPPMERPCLVGLCRCLIVTRDSVFGRNVCDVLAYSVSCTQPAESDMWRVWRDYPPYVLLSGLSRTCEACGGTTLHMSV